MERDKARSWGFVLVACRHCGVHGALCGVPFHGARHGGCIPAGMCCIARAGMWCIAGWRVGVPLNQNSDKWLSSVTCHLPLQALERKRKQKTDAALEVRRHTGGRDPVAVGVLRLPLMHAALPSAALDVRRHGGLHTNAPSNWTAVHALWHACTDSPLHPPLPSPAVRALSCFQEAVMLCNTAEPGWPMLYCNDQWCSSTGACARSVLKQKMVVATARCAAAMHPRGRRTADRRGSGCEGVLCKICTGG